MTKQKLTATIILLTLLAPILFPLASSQSQPSQITITADGSVIGTDSIKQNGNTYTLTGNLTSPIVIETDNIVLDGAGFSVKGSGKIINQNGINQYNGSENQTAVSLAEITNVTIENMVITAFGLGIALYNSTHCTLSANKFYSDNQAYTSVVQLTIGLHKMISKILFIMQPICGIQARILLPKIMLAVSWLFLGQIMSF